LQNGIAFVHNNVIGLTTIETGGFFSKTPKNDKDEKIMNQLKEILHILRNTPFTSVPDRDSGALRALPLPHTSLPRDTPPARLPPPPPPPPARLPPPLPNRTSIKTNKKTSKSKKTSKGGGDRTGEHLQEIRNGAAGLKPMQNRRDSESVPAVVDVPGSLRDLVFKKSVAYRKSVDGSDDDDDDDSEWKAPWTTPRVCLLDRFSSW
jgi:type IV secretory pathway VirB10-like protein